MTFDAYYLTMMATGGSFSCDCELIRVAVTLVLKGEGFSLTSTLARDARDSAEKLLEWSSLPENKSAWEVFTEELVRCLSCCFGEPRAGGMRRICEYMWEGFYELRSSQAFIDLWASFFWTASRVNLPRALPFSTNLSWMLSWKT